MAIINPNGPDRTVPFDQISKRKLARVCNEQAETIQQLRRQVQQVGRALIAIALEPEGLTHPATGHVRVAAGAFERVRLGQDLNFTPHDDGSLTISVTQPEEKAAIHTPRIVGLN